MFDEVTPVRRSGCRVGYSGSMYGSVFGVRSRLGVWEGGEVSFFCSMTLRSSLRFRLWTLLLRVGVYTLLLDGVILHTEFWIQGEGLRVGMGLGSSRVERNGGGARLAHHSPP